MSRPTHNFAAAEPLPIPEDVRPGPGWTGQMIELADHIGAYATLLLVDRFAGMRIYVTADWTRGKSYEGKGSVRELIGDQAAQILSQVYGTEYLELPVARQAVERAKRAPILAAVREGRMTITAAAIRLRSRRPYISHLINQTDEGDGGDDGAGAGRVPGLRDPGQLDMFGDDEEA